MSQRWIQHNGKVRWHIEIPFKNWLSLFCGESSEAGYWYLLLSLPVTRVQSQAYRAAVREQNTVLVKISIVLNVEEMNGGHSAEHAKDPLKNLVLDLDARVPDARRRLPLPPAPWQSALS